MGGTKACKIVAVFCGDNPKSFKDLDHVLHNEIPLIIVDGS